MVLCKRFLFTFMLICCFSVLRQEKVLAAVKYEILEDENGITGFCANKQMKKVYVALKESGDAYKVVSPATKGSQIYYFDKNGIGNVCLDTGFVRISYAGQKKTYYLKEGDVETNQIVGNKKQGYYYVDAGGVRVTDKTIMLAVKFVGEHTESSDSRSKKLKKCYYYFASNYKYERNHSNLYPKAKDMKSMANDILLNKKGNCHRYAAGFAYIAKVLGYDVKVVVGKITLSSGRIVPHGWNEIKKGGKWYVCDSEMEVNGRVASYMKTVTPCKTLVKRRCTMTVKNGKVIWK